jgi:hypothetical protein
LQRRRKTTNLQEDAVKVPVVLVVAAQALVALVDIVKVVAVQEVAVREAATLEIAPQVVLTTWTATASQIAKGRSTTLSSTAR